LPGAKEAPEKFRQLLKARSGGEMKSSDAEALRRAELEMLYGAYLERPDLDPSATLPRTLHKLDAATTLSLVRRTLAVGTPTQKQRALTLLASADDEYRDEAVSLARYASEQARRRGDGSLAAAADAVKQRLRGDIDREGPPWPTTTRGTR
jgi:hypothetical protein